MGEKMKRDASGTIWLVALITCLIGIPWGLSMYTRGLKTTTLMGLGILASIIAGIAVLRFMDCLDVLTLCQGQISRLKKERKELSRIMALPDAENRRARIAKGDPSSRKEQIQDYNNLDRAILECIDKKAQAYRKALCVKHGIPEELYRGKQQDKASSSGATE